MPRPKVTVDDVPVEPYVSGPVLCMVFDIAPNTLNKWKKLPGFPMHFIIGGEPRYLISEVQGFVFKRGEQDMKNKLPGQAARAEAARAARSKKSA